MTTRAAEAKHHCRPTLNSGSSAARQVTLHSVGWLGTTSCHHTSRPSTCRQHKPTSQGSGNTVDGGICMHGGRSQPLQCRMHLGACNRSPGRPATCRTSDPNLFCQNPASLSAVSSAKSRYRLTQLAWNLSRPSPEAALWSNTSTCGTPLRWLPSSPPPAAAGSPSARRRLE